jgi:hypothetical protein
MVNSFKFGKIEYRWGVALALNVFEKFHLPGQMKNFPKYIHARTKNPRGLRRIQVSHAS